MPLVYSQGYGDEGKQGEILGLVKMRKDFSLGLSITEEERKRIDSSIAICWTEIII